MKNIEISLGPTYGVTGRVTKGVNLGSLKNFYMIQDDQFERA